MMRQASNQGKIIEVKLRSFEWLMATYKHKVRHFKGYDELNVWHSTGGGGGLHIKREHTHLFGSGEIVKVVFHRQTLTRNIYQLFNDNRHYPQQLYDEWFILAEIDMVLPKELFEI